MVDCEIARAVSLRVDAVLGLTPQHIELCYRFCCQWSYAKASYRKLADVLFIG